MMGCLPPFSSGFRISQPSTEEVFSKLGIARLELLQKLCQMAFSGSDITIPTDGLCKPFPNASGREVYPLVI